jgi:hypothetical protein
VIAAGAAGAVPRGLVVSDDGRGRRAGAEVGARRRGGAAVEPGRVASSPVTGPGRTAPDPDL